MLVVRKLDRELAFVFCFGRLVRTVRFAKSKAPSFTRCGTHVADGANGRAGEHKSLTCEKLLAMTTYTSVMVWKVSNVGKRSLRSPFSGKRVARVTSQALVPGGGVEKSGILCGRAPRRLLLR